MKIILVEDNDIDAFVAQHMLSTYCKDCTITRFVNGKEAVEYLMEEDLTTPFVILLDINMPIMDGLEFMQEIEKIGFREKLNITVLTSSTNDQDIATFKNFGVDNYYIKPLTMESSREILDFARTA